MEETETRIPITREYLRPNLKLDQDSIRINHLDGQEPQGSKPGSASSPRSQGQRVSLLGKPIHTRIDRRDIRYRTMQLKLYNFLERPKDWRQLAYHLFVFLMVFLCLMLSVFSTIDHYEAVAGQFLYYLEIVMVVWFSVELIVRVWSAGCRSRYRKLYGRAQFIKRPLCIVDVTVISAGITILCMGSSGQVFATSALRGLRFFQILRMVRVDRRGGSWKLLGSVLWDHRQELFTTVYIGFLGLIFSSFWLYMAEKDKNPTMFGSYAHALWWGVITLCTVGYGDAVPITWTGKLIASFCALMGISFFALPAGILGSGFALKVQQLQRQKHLIRRRIPAAILIQSLWRCYAADKSSSSTATWTYYLHQSTVSSPQIECPKLKALNSSLISRLSTRRRDKFSARNPQSPSISFSGSDQAPSLFTNNTSTILEEAPLVRGLRERQSVVSDCFLPGAYLLNNGKVNGVHRKESDNISERISLQSSLPDGIGSTSLAALIRRTVDPNFRDIKDSDADETVQDDGQWYQLTEAQKNAIRGLRKIQYFVARRKFREALKPYDVKDVIEQYSAGHLDMLSRIKSLQSRLDLITGNSESARASFYEPRVTLTSRMIQIERQIGSIECKLDVLLELYNQDRQQDQELRASCQSPNFDTVFYDNAQRRNSRKPNSQTIESADKMEESNLKEYCKTFKSSKF